MIEQNGLFHDFLRFSGCHPELETQELIPREQRVSYKPYVTAHDATKKL